MNFGNGIDDLFGDNYSLEGGIHLELPSGFTGVGFDAAGGKDVFNSQWDYAIAPSAAYGAYGQQ